jgi:hypothetical protein
MGAGADRNLNLYRNYLRNLSTNLILLFRLRGEIV